MPMAILATKLYIPTPRPNVVSRLRLIEIMNKGLHQNHGFGRKLTLISAPAGFGKSTLVCDWLQQLDIPCAWISLDESDNDPVRFIIYLVAALQNIAALQKSDISFGESVLAALQSPMPPPTESILTTIINEVTIFPEHFVLVLDDYHCIEATSVIDTFSFLIENLPTKMHLIIATREEPQLPLARYRVRDHMTELRAVDLRFSPAEAAEFLNRTMGLNLSDDDITALESRTEGWIAGLQLAAVSMQGNQDPSGFIKSFTGSHHFILDYLLEEVLHKQPENIQTFLLHTSILDQLTGSLCDALCLSATDTYQEDGQLILRLLERANLFIIPLDNERRWYRYHHLFADLLRQYLSHFQADQLTVLHQRASQWYEENGFVDEAIAHAIAAENFEEAAALIENQFDNDFERGDLTLMGHWLTEIPEELVLSRPYLSILHGWILFSSGQLKAAEDKLQAAEKLLDPNSHVNLDSLRGKGQLSDPERLILLGRAASIRSFIVSYGGNIPETIRYALQALECLPEQEKVWRSAAFITLGDAYSVQGQMDAAHKARTEALSIGRASGNIYILTIINLNLAETLRQQGKLQQVIEICERQLKDVDANGIAESPLAGWLFGIWGEVLAEKNELDRAGIYVQKGVELAERGMDVMHIVTSHLCQLIVLFSMGKIKEAENVIQSMEDAGGKYDIPLRALQDFFTWKVRIQLSLGKLELASQWIDERKLDPDRELNYLNEMEYVMLARIFIARGQLDSAILLLQRLFHCAEEGGRTSRVIEILILQALAAQSAGDMYKAISSLEQALSLAEAGGFVRIFVNEGPQMAHLLYEALSRNIAPEYVRRLLGAYPAEEPEQVDIRVSKKTGAEMIEPLSDRETEVLHLLAEGLTNQEIADRIYISLNTVKTHTRNIYGKLDTHHRTSAVAKARALGILKLS